MQNKEVKKWQDERLNEAKYWEEQFGGLRPMNCEKRRSQALPENYDEIVGEAIQEHIWIV